MFISIMLMTLWGFCSDPFLCSSLYMSHPFILKCIAKQNIDRNPRIINEKNYSFTLIGSVQVAINSMLMILHREVVFFYNLDLAWFYARDRLIYQ